MHVPLDYPFDIVCCASMLNLLTPFSIFIGAWSAEPPPSGARFSVAWETESCDGDAESWQNLAQSDISMLFRRKQNLLRGFLWRRTSVRGVFSWGLTVHEGEGDLQAARMLATSGSQAHYRSRSPGPRSPNLHIPRPQIPNYPHPQVPDPQI